ncbi:MAG: hypothetical protein ACK4JA_01065, partial [Parazoarcus communis]
QAMWLLLVIAVVMQWLYTFAYGGFFGLLQYSELIRSSIFMVENPLSFLKPFGGLALFSSFGFWGIWLAKGLRFNIVLGFVLSCGFSLYVLLSWLGRIGFLVYLATLLLGWLLSLRVRPFFLLSSVVLLMASILMGAYYISLWFELKAADSLLSFLAKELSFPFGSFFAQLAAGEHLFRGFKDFLLAPLFLFPSSWWSSWVENVSQVNTALIMGAPKGEQGVTGGIPVDLLTLGSMQAHVMGIPIVGMMFGVVLHLIQNMLYRLPNPGVQAVFSAYAALKLAVLGVFYAQPALVVSGNFDFLISVLIVVVVLRMPRVRWDVPRSSLQK